MVRRKGVRCTPSHKPTPTQARLGSKAREQLAAKLELNQCHIERLEQQREAWARIQRAWPVDTILEPGETTVIKLPQPDVMDQKRPNVITNVYRASRSCPGKMCRLELQSGAATWRVVMDPVLERMDIDCEREIGLLEREAAEIRMLLNPPIGRPQERMYDKALVEQEEDPSLTFRSLAEKHLPHYFPAHAEAAIDAMRHGLASARKRKKPRRRP